MSDRGLRELERLALAGDRQAQADLAKRNCRVYGHGERTLNEMEDGSVKFFCDVCGLDFIVMGVMESFLKAGKLAAAEEYMRYSSLYMEQLPDGRWRRGRPR